jgi:hypothetical protein
MFRNFGIPFVVLEKAAFIQQLAFFIHGVPPVYGV